MDKNRFKELLSTDQESKVLQFGCCCNSAFHYDGTSLDTNAGEATITWFFYNLLKDLQKIGSVPAIDYDAYLKYT